MTRQELGPPSWDATDDYARTTATALLELFADPDEAGPQPLTREDLAHHRLWLGPPDGDAKAIPAATAWSDLPPAWRSDATGGHTPLLAMFDRVEDIPGPQS